LRRRWRRFNAHDIRPLVDGSTCGDALCEGAGCGYPVRHIGDTPVSTWPALFGQRGVQSSWMIQREFDITRTRRRSLRTRVPPLVTPPGFHGAGGESHRRTHL